MKRKGQLTLDFLVGIALTMIVLTSTFSLSLSLFQEKGRENALKELQIFALTIKTDAEKVYSLGGNFAIKETFKSNYFGSVYIEKTTNGIAVYGNYNGEKLVVIVKPKVPIQLSQEPFPVPNGGTILIKSKVTQQGGITVEVTQA